MPDLRVHTWSELQEALFADAWNPDLQRFRSQYAFRGLSDASHRLSTSLKRLGGPYAEMETHLLRNFRKYARTAAYEDAVWHWLSLAQHHGLPTRLLDWTYSPLVAMHFATANSDKFHLDGVIWAVHYGRAHDMLPQSLSQQLEHEGSDVFTVEMLTSVAPTLKDFAALSREPFLLFFEPPSIDERIVNQYALFSTMSEPGIDLDDWLAAHPELWRRILIPAELKWEIRDKLDQANITERVLFPGLDGLTSWLRRHYRPRNPETGEAIASNGESNQTHPLDSHHSLPLDRGSTPKRGGG